MQNPSIDGYSGAFGYNQRNGATIVVEATKSKSTTTNASAFDILRDVVMYVPPTRRLTFERQGNVSGLAVAGSDTHRSGLRLAIQTVAGPVAGEATWAVLGLEPRGRSWKSRPPLCG